MIEGTGSTNGNSSSSGSRRMESEVAVGAAGVGMDTDVRALESALAQSAAESRLLLRSVDALGAKVETLTQVFVVMIGVVLADAVLTKLLKLT